MKVLLTALNAHYMHTNLAIRQLKEACRGMADTEIELCELHINLPYRRVLDDIARKKPDAVGFSCYIWNIGFVMRLCRALRLALPETVIFLGGPEVAHTPEETLREHGCIDAVLSGEGELVLPPFLSAIRDGKPMTGIAGVSARNEDGNISVTPPPALMCAEEWPDAYSGGAEGLENRIVYIETSRGCPYNCQYCLSSRGEKVRALSAEEAVRRLTALSEAGVKLIKLVDRTFNFDRERAKAIWRALIEHAGRTGVNPTYHFEIAANLLDAESVELLSSAPEGLFQFEAGVQSASDEVLRNVGRSVPFEPVKNAVMAVGRAGNIHLHTDLIAGLPGEDMDSFERSFDETFALGAQMLQLGFLKLLKGSGLRRDAEKLGIVYEPDAPYEVISTREMSFEELSFLKDVEAVLEWYHNSGRYPASLKLLLQKKRPFELFAHLAREFREKGVLDTEKGERARAEALLETGGGFADEGMLAQLIRHDLISCGRRRDLPERLKFEESPEERAILRERFHPVRGQSAYTYDFDVRRFAESGEYVPGRVMIVYEQGSEGKMRP